MLKCTHKADYQEPAFQPAFQWKSEGVFTLGKSEEERKGDLQLIHNYFDSIQYPCDIENVIKAPFTRAQWMFSTNFKIFCSFQWTKFRVQQSLFFFFHIKKWQVVWFSLLIYMFVIMHHSFLVEKETEGKRTLWWVICFNGLQVIRLYTIAFSIISFKWKHPLMYLKCTHHVPINTLWD